MMLGNFDAGSGEARLEWRGICRYFGKRNQYLRDEFFM